MQHIDKPWGHIDVLKKTPKYMVQRLFMEAGKRCSKQLHLFKYETVFVLSGTLEVELETGTWVLNEGDWIHIPAKKIHRMRAFEDTVYLECSTPHLNDVVRIEDDYGRE